MTSSHLAAGRHLPAEPPEPAELPAPSWPPLLVFTDRQQAIAAGHPLETVVTALARLPVWVVLREKDLDVAPRRVLAERVAAATRAVGVGLVVASDAGLARRVGARGLHLARQQPRPANAEGVIGRSAHDIEELADAVRQGVDYVTVSPVFPTASKPGHGPPLGPDGLAELVAASPLPVYALGGIGPDEVASCIDAGATGVAVMGEIMRAPDPRTVASAIVAAVLDARPGASRETTR